MSAATVGRSGRVRAFVAGAAVISLTMLLVSAANYVLNFALARLLDPAQFGDATLAITVVLTAAVIAATLQLVASRSVAAHPESVDSVRRMLVRTAAIAGLGAALLLGGGAWMLADALNTSSPWMFVILGAGLPVYFVQAVYRGVLQGRLRFGRLAVSYGAEAVVRLSVVLGLVAAGFGVIGASVGILLSFLVSAAIVRTRTRTGARSAAEPALPWSELRVTVAAAVIMLLAQTVLNNADLVLAKAVFDPATAGVYAAAAVLCRSLYFVSWSVVQVVVPVIASATSTPVERRRSLALATGVIGGMGAVAVALMATFGPTLVNLLFGPAYAAAVPLLVPYTVATALLSLATLVAAADIARGRFAAAVVLLGGAVAQVAVLALVATTPSAMVWLQVLTTGATLVAQQAVAIARRRRTRAAPPESPSGPVPAPVADAPSIHTPTFRHTTARTEELMTTNTTSAYAAYVAWRDTPNTEPVDLSIVIPAYNEQARIVPTIGAFAAHLARTNLTWELIVSDDGSRDATRVLIALIDHANVRIIGAPANAGKGAAVRRGFAEARGRMVLFSDADNATPAQEVDRLIAQVDAGAQVAIGSRAAAGADVANRSVLRRTMTAGLRTVVRVGLGIGVADTQCGFKLFTAEAARRIAAAQTVDGFSFDLEILHLAERFGYTIAEVPVRWFDAPGSTVRPGREALRFVTSIARIRLNDIRGVYRNA